VEIGELLQYYMLNTVFNFLFKNFIALWSHLAKTQLLSFIHIVQIDLSITQFRFLHHPVYQHSMAATVFVTEYFKPTSATAIIGWCVTSHLCQLSLAILQWTLRVINMHSTQCT